MPKLIEDAIKERLTGETQKNTLDFIASLQENGFSFVGFDDEGGGWDPVHKDKDTPGCVLVTDQFMFFIGLDWRFDENNPVDEELKEFACAHVPICPQGPCQPPYCQGDEYGHNHSKNHWQIFGKEYESACHSPLQFIGPDAKTLDNIKKLLLITK